MKKLYSLYILLTALFIGCAGMAQKSVIKYMESMNPAFSKANPAYLEGTWAYSTRIAPYNIEITFDRNNRFTTAAVAGTIKRKGAAEGTYFFNENTIILSYEKFNGKDYFQKEIIYYELTDDILFIKPGGGGDSSVGAIHFAGLKGEYYKSNKRR